MEISLGVAVPIHNRLRNFTNYGSFSLRFFGTQEPWFKQWPENGVFE